MTGDYWKKKNLKIYCNAPQRSGGARNYKKPAPEKTITIENFMQLIAIKTPKIRPENDFVQVFFESLKKTKYKIRDGDIVCIVSKVVSLTEGRLVALESARTERTQRVEGVFFQSGSADQNQLQKSARADFSASNLAQKKSARADQTALNVLKRYGEYAPNPALTALIKKEADTLYEGDMFLTIKDGIFIPSAGIDTSNVPEGTAILWPRDAYRSAERIRTQILKKINQKRGKKTNYNDVVKNSKTQRIKNLGVLIFDSHVLPLRRGVTGIALGYAGFEGVEDCRGRRDLEGKKLRVTFRNIADNLASAATLLTGEADEKTPFVIIRDAAGGPEEEGGNSTHFSQHASLTPHARIQFTDKKIRRSEIQIPPEECLYKTLY